MSQRNKYANSNLNGVLSSQKTGSGFSQPYSQPARYGSGLVSLGSSKKARLPASNSASKLAVPKPVNLPSLRKENAGNDPNTQIVPSGSGASWQKVEEPAPTPADLRQTALSAGSTWASTQSRESGWQPPAPQLPALPPPRPGSRRLNPHEYPSLSAAATPRQLNLPKQRVPSVPDSQGVAIWDEDERRLPVAGPSQPAQPDRAEEDRGFRPPWEDRADGYSGRGLGDGYGSGARGFDEDRWVPRGGQDAPPPPQRPYGRPPPGRFGSQDRFGDFPPFADDAALFPPPPPPARQPPPPPRTEAAADHVNGGKSVEVDPEREAFLAELDRVAQDLEKERQRKLEQEVVVVAEEEPVPEIVEPPPPVKQPSGPLTLAQVAAANVTEVDEPAEAVVPQNRKLARRQRELEEEEAERKRKEAAAAKLKALDEAIAAREAERRALEELAAKDAAEKLAEEEAKAARAAAEAAAIAHEKAESELAALTLEAEQQEAAAMPPTPASAGVSERTAIDQDPEGSAHGSSIDVQANSSVAQDALSDDDRAVSVVSLAQDAAAPLPNAWKRARLPNGTPDAWEEKPAPAPPPRGPKRGTDLPKPAAEHEASDKEVAALSKPDAQPAAPKKAIAVGSAEGSAPMDANGTGDAAAPPAPPLVVQPKGPPISWRKILAGDDGPSTPPQETVQEEREPRAVDGGRPTRGRGRDGRGRVEREGQHIRDAGAPKDGDSVRGRGRGRGRGERPPRAAPRKPAEPTSPGMSVSAEAGVADVGAADGAAGGKRGRQRGDNTRGRGGRDAAAVGRGRGRGVKATGRGAAVPTPAPHVASPAPDAPAPAAVSPSADPPLAFVETPAVPQDKQQPKLEAAPVIAAVPPGLGWDTMAEPPGLGGWGTSVGGSLPMMSPAEGTTSLAGDSRSSRFASSLDPIAIKSPIAESSDPPVERPKSAAGVVGAVARPRSASNAAAAGSSSLGQDVLPNGIPALPADLSLDPLPAPSSEPLSMGFGGPRSSAAPIGPAAFPGVLFSLPGQGQGGNMWQQFGQPQASAAQQGSAPQQQGAQDQSAFNLSAAKQSFYNAGGDQSQFGSGSSYGGGGIGSSPQFGAFSSTQFGQGVPPGLQFGQLRTGFGAPFIPTGKQADWSTGAASKQPDWSTGPLGKQPDWSVGPLGTTSQAAGAQAFSRPGPLDSVVHATPYTSQHPSSDPLSRNGGLPQSNGNLEMHRQSPPEGIVGKAGETSAVLHDTAAGLPDDVFSPEDIRSSVEPAPPRVGGPTPGGGGRRGGRGRMGSPPMRGMPTGRGGYARGRGREAGTDVVPVSNDGGGHQHQRRREGGPAAGQPRAPPARRHPGEGAPPQEAGGRDGGQRGRGAGRARGGRGGARGGQPGPVTAWVPLPQGA